jgi:hypothetical protein
MVDSWLLGFQVGLLGSAWDKFDFTRARSFGQGDKA